MTSRSPSSPAWTTLSILMHWLIVLLIVVQFLDNESMVALWDGTLEKTPIAPTDVTFGWVHIVTGSLILVAVLIRLADRVRNGRPPYSDREPTFALYLAKTTHVLIYAILVAMPAAGLAAWFTGQDAIAGIHTFFWVPLLVLIGLHVAGALAQHFYFKTNALRRIVGIKG